MKCSFCLLCVSVALFLPLPAMSICQVPQPRLVRAEYFASPLVIEGTLTRTSDDESEKDKNAHPDLPPPAYIYSLRVNRVLRGKAAGIILIYEANDSGRATFDWVPGREYLLFLSKSSERKGDWALDGCGNSGSLVDAKTALSEIATIKTARGGGIIQGVVRGSEQLPFAPVPGLHVEAQGTTGRYSATTNEVGEFQIDVPVGQYTVRVVGGGRFFDKAVFGYEDPSRIQIEPGGCAQVELAEIERPPSR
jgi:hypothetical protein